MSIALNDSPWPSSADGYELVKKIGHGAFSIVWKAFCLSKEEHCAIKILDLEKSQTFEDISQEVNAMKLCFHPNVVRCFASFLCGNQLWVVMRFMDKGSCFHVLNAAVANGRKAGMNEDWIVYILKETITGLQYFHQNGQIHRDIKAGNILLSSDGTVQLADFGVAGKLISFGLKRSSVKSFVGTPCWMAPEVMEQREGYDQKADIWSLGITALELAKGYAPYAKLDPMKVLLKTIENSPPDLKSYDDDKQPNGEPFSRHFKEFIRLCLQKDPKKRPSCTYLLNLSLYKKKGIGPELFLSEFLNSIACVGETDVDRRQRMPGTLPAYYIDGMVSKNQKGFKPSEAHPPGTTWVFEDESSVVLNRNGGKTDRDQEGEVLDFYDEFEKMKFPDDSLK